MSTKGDSCDSSVLGDYKQTPSFITKTNMIRQIGIYTQPSKCSPSKASERNNPSQNFAQHVLSPHLPPKYDSNKMLTTAFDPFRNKNECVHNHTPQAFGSGDLHHHVFPSQQPWAGLYRQHRTAGHDLRCPLQAKRVHITSSQT